jgi:hypothetical protein
MKIPPVRAKLFNAEDTDGRKEDLTDTTKPTVDLINFANPTRTLTLLVQWRKGEIHTKL